MRFTNSTFSMASLPAIAAALIAAAPLHAQDSAAQEDTATAEDSTPIVVTGSRLKRDPNSTEPVPVTTVDATSLRNFGASDPTAALRLIPALISSSTVADSLERGPAVPGGANTVGQASINLRQLGANRTLVLVDGWRHVSGVAGTQSVDVSTIPRGLIERVDVLTGGASAIYGADAVTGVVNYILKRDFEGVQIDAQMGISSAGDGRTARIEGLVGKNFGGGRGNVTLAAGYTKDNEILMGARAFTRDNGRGNNSTTYANPLRRFQVGEITAAATPNFANFYRIGGPGASATRFPYGAVIPTAAQAATQFPGVALTAAEQALIARAASAPTFVIGGDPRFAISSNAGLIYRRDFGFFSADINGNGVGDCNETFTGRLAGGGGGCYVTDTQGNVRIVRDGVISTGTNQFGGDGSVERTNQTSLIPGSERIYANLRASYEFSDAARIWIDAKYTRNNTVSRNNYNSFYDTLLIFPENPFIPQALRADATAARGLRISRDFLDLGPGISTAERDTYRIVGGIDGDITPHLKYQLVGNYGRTDNVNTSSNSVRYDRLFAAIDVVQGPNGPTCRSTLNPTAAPHPGSEFFPVIAPGFFTFTPGANSGCVPVNLFRGVNSVTPEAANWITTPTTNRFRLEQTVITGMLNGDTGAFLNLPGGPISFLVGGEYRDESSRSRFDDLILGLLPAGSPAGPAGTFIGNVSRNQRLVFDPTTRQFNAGGSFDVKEVFGEIRVPLLADMPFFHELSFGAAGRYADYSTVGGNFTWNANGVWAPIRDIRLRGSYARAVRAPNIAELFNPQQGATFRPNDPCNQSLIDQLIRENRPNAQTRLRNCRADNIPVGYEDPLTARFSGTSGGNPNLREETATTWSVGGVIQPRFIPGFSVSADYYAIEITDAIQAVDAQTIVNTCYDLPTFPNNFCTLFTRNPGNRGFNFLTQTQINFAKLETRGIDFQANYAFSLGKNNFNLALVGNWTERLDRFFDPVRTDFVNPGLRELGAPEWSGFANVTWNRGDFSLNYGVQYIESTAVAGAIEIERIDTEFGPAGFAPDYWIHNVAFNLDVTDEFSLYGGINNLTNEIPYISSSAYPVSGMGRAFFLGVTARY
ncbi:TonB-dependent receptor domain-containing protein [Erythrobacter sp. WG]|uniref:TonB-dependent receptor domain-containing protein n=1 Tax=Erythrobacter sp. WG TaxID=2985510 RepID=UPI00226F41A0|nr:TonB-dependent receptor [Erythrobacter sp. WG]MCX9146390.1 TonB-dependent receptor [Erythrobacter sp. WG]